MKFKILLALASLLSILNAYGQTATNLLADTGKIGIGTLSPTSTLSVYSPIANKAEISIQSGGDTRFTIQEGGNVLKIGPNSTAVLNMTNTGYVGIGTTTPGTNKLAVEGTIAARRVKVTQSSTWPDFVFDSSYLLPSLKDVENYVTVNKHLSEVPSAAAIDKDGHDLGEMNRILLQKVEELTLYLIKMQKQIDQLNETVNR